MQTLRDRLLFILNSSSPDYETAREVIGQYLHILQMFYSNTNWDRVIWREHLQRLRYFQLLMF
ncbi:hypothetical protein KUTeg_014882 [Tegillarca granosa]|uniref:VWA7 N-terminal domain-containing protein n=1 Tax=Tegillarca granosa TaxID=220873 RepID=A0ABQ9ENG9_TEGGR|nr:hypothetical protein KUTeg_014882 [Tegillarca granosa]